MEREDEVRWRLAVAAALRSERGVAGLSQAEAGRLAGIARTSYRLYEEAERQPDVVQIAAIAEAFGISFSRLMNEIQQRAEFKTAPAPYALRAARRGRLEDDE